RFTSDDKGLGHRYLGPMPYHRLIPVILTAILFSDAYGESITVAVASNFARPAHEIAERFEEASGHSVRVTTASTGKLYAQIVNGAPFDVLLAADEERPRLLEESGLGIKGTRFTYAIGALTLWSRDDELAGKDCMEQLTKLGTKRLAIANPWTAPYGVAAKQFLVGAGLWSIVKLRLVFGENISQTLHFVASGNASLGLIARSQALDERLPASTCEWPVPASMHEPLEQQAILLQRALPNESATGFVDFLRGPVARQIISDRGYTVPQ
ncbi:MAG: molybdate ABC transporter substrate-binding protein, partial [Gammaproteobacteria bacterium]|nr:molybdate ABC transporter substrate-binding protein [Gammaproteobacteria bacterium]